MTLDALVQLSAVLLGGILAIVGGIWTTSYNARQAQLRESRNLAHAFKGEITAMVELIEERAYLKRLTEIGHQIERTREPFFTPFKIRFRYDRVYDTNVAKIGLLKHPLPEQIPLFYTRLTSIMEDMVSLGDGTYADCDLDLLLRIYGDTVRLLRITLDQGKEIIATIDREYRDGW
jgi:hypothetical protein